MMMNSIQSPNSCDTFVVLPPATSNGCVIFGKNSDRHEDEVQEVIYCSAAKHEDKKVQCTYIEVDQVKETYACILSKPAWMWGAEMGSNEFGVTVGNEAIWTKLNDETEDMKEKLLGMDLLRLGLERSKTAKECLLVITSLLKEYGQGGSCCEYDPSFTYHNSFLICDPTESWVLETAGSHWAAEKITNGTRNISNVLTITTEIDMMSDGLEEFAKNKGYWKPEKGEFNFSLAFSDSVDSYRLECGKDLLEQFTKEGNFKETDMFKILRDKDSGICMCSGSSVTTSSQVSVLAPSGSNQPSCHWFTGTVDPSKSIFKPFVFCGNVRISSFIVSPKYSDADDPVKIKPRFDKKVDRMHKLYSMHQNAYKNFNKVKLQELQETLKALELQCIEEIQLILSNENKTLEQKLEEMTDVFKDAVETEIKFYK